jgi:hypothetical protein
MDSKDYRVFSVRGSGFKKNPMGFGNLPTKFKKPVKGISRP